MANEKYKVENPCKKCGKVRLIQKSELNIKSILCVKCSKIKHGFFGTRQYGIWVSMKGRCKNRKADDYKYYGARGITYDKRWEKFENFWEDMKDGYSDNLTLDRINVNGNYEKANCRWITNLEQQSNKRNNVYIKLGDKNKSISKWAEETNMKASMIYDRLKKGWDTKKILNTPKRTIQEITYKGETNVISYFAKKYSIKPATLTQRINKYKWSVEDAINTKTRIRTIC